MKFEELRIAIDGFTTAFNSNMLRDPLKVLTQETPAEKDKREDMEESNTTRKIAGKWLKKLKSKTRKKVEKEIEKAYSELEREKACSSGLNQLIEALRADKAFLRNEKTSLESAQSRLYSTINNLKNQTERDAERITSLSQKILKLQFSLSDTEKMRINEVKKRKEMEQEGSKHIEHLESEIQKLKEDKMFLENELSCVKKNLDKDRLRKIVLGVDSSSNNESYSVLTGYWKDLEVVSYISGSISDDVAP